MKEEKGFYIQQYYNKWRIGEYTFLNDENNTAHFRGWEVGKGCIQASCFETSDTYSINAIKKNPIYPISIELWERVKSIIFNIVHDIKNSIQILPSHPFDIKYGQCYYYLTECNLYIGRFRLPYEPQMPLVDSAYILDLREEDWFLSILQDKMGLPDYENLIQLDNCIYDDCIKRIENTSLLLIHIITAVSGSIKNMKGDILLPHDNLNSEVTQEDLKTAWMDQFGVQYSADKLRLLKAPKDLESYTVLSGTKIICDASFRHNSSLINVSFPVSVVAIGRMAFKDCVNLKSILITDRITTIGEHAFEGCNKLSQLNLPKNINYIPNYAFYGCDRLKSIVIPYTVTNIGAYAFYGCDLKSITIPRSVTAIERSAFENCFFLASILIPDTVTYIGNKAFEKCPSLSSVTIPDSVTSLGDCAFKDCIGLTSIKISNNITSIRNETFKNCDIHSVVIPKGVTYIGHNAFEDCCELKNITLPQTLETIGEYVFSGCTKIESIRILDGVTSIGRFAFNGCSLLKSIFIPDSVECIGRCVFEGCDNLISIFVPSGSTDKFEKLMPEYKGIFIEQEDL